MEALEQAWSSLPLSRSSLGLLEGHGTGTKAGDAAELKTIAAFFGPHDGKGAKPVLGTIKSMIGHSMAAAGIAGFIKTALAVHHGVLPPTLHCEEPHPLLASTRFRTIGAAEPWPLEPEKRVAAVNAFGFGGSTRTRVVRGYEAPVARVSAAASQRKAMPPVLLLSAETREALIARLEAGEATDAPSSAAGLPARDRRAERSQADDRAEGAHLGSTVARPRGRAPLRGGPHRQRRTDRVRLPRPRRDVRSARRVTSRTISGCPPAGARAARSRRSGSSTSFEASWASTGSCSTRGQRARDPSGRRRRPQPRRVERAPRRGRDRA